MEQPTTQRWFLRKHEDGSVFGPLSFEQLERWASNAQVAPHDAISTDQLTWMKAPMLPELAMDWLVELTSESYYGPTTLGAVQEFIRLGDIDHETCIINACDGTRMQVQDMPALLEPAAHHVDLTSAPHPAIGQEPGISGIEIEMQDRIRDLEQSLAEERRALQDSEERYRNLEQRYRELEEKASSGSST
jgi:hypothetical protein